MVTPPKLLSLYYLAPLLSLILLHSPPSFGSCLKEYPYLNDENGNDPTTEEDCRRAYHAYWGRDLPVPSPTSQQTVENENPKKPPVKPKELKLQSSPLLNGSYILRNEPANGNPGSIMKFNGNLTQPSLFFWNKQRHLSVEYSELIEKDGVVCKQEAKKVDFYLDEGRKIESNREYDLWDLPAKDPKRRTIAKLSCNDTEFCPKDAVKKGQVQCQQDCEIKVTNPCNGEITFIDLKTQRIKSFGAKRHTTATVGSKNGAGEEKTACLAQKPYRDFPGLKAVFDWVKYLHSSLMVASEAAPVVKRWLTAGAYNKVQSCDTGGDGTPKTGTSRLPASILNNTNPI